MKCKLLSLLLFIMAAANTGFAEEPLSHYIMLGDEELLRQAMADEVPVGEYVLPLNEYITDKHLVAAHPDLSKECKMDLLLYIDMYFMYYISLNGDGRSFNSIFHPSLYHIPDEVLLYFNAAGYGKQMFLGDAESSGIVTLDTVDYEPLDVLIGELEAQRDALTTEMVNDILEEALEGPDTLDDSIFTR